MTRRTTVVLLTRTGPEHRFVATRLAASRPGLAAIVAVSPPHSRIRERVPRTIRRYGLAGLADRAARRALLEWSGESRRRRRQMSTVLGDGGFPADVPIHSTTGENSSETRALLDSLAPDILCVYGTGIVGARTLAAARTVALNMHTGLSPRYRGADCAFWPLFDRDPAALGATVHVCTTAVDGGAVYATDRAQLKPDDGVGAVFARCVQVGAELYRKVVDDLDVGVAAPVTQDLDAGVEYRAAMRTLVAEIAVMRAVRSGLIRRHVLIGTPGGAGAGSI